MVCPSYQVPHPEVLGFQKWVLWAANVSLRLCLSFTGEELLLRIIVYVKVICPTTGGIRSKLGGCKSEQGHHSQVWLGMGQNHAQSPDSLP